MMKEFTLSGNAYFDSVYDPVLLVKDHKLCYFNYTASQTFWPTRLEEDGPVPEELAQEAEGVVTIRGVDWMCHRRQLPDGELYQLHKAEASRDFEVLLNRLAGRDASNLLVLNHAIHAVEGKLVETERLRMDLDLADLRRAYARLLRSSRNIDYFCQMTPSEVDVNFPMRVIDIAGLCREVHRQCEYLLETIGITLIHREDAGSGSILVRGNDQLLFHMLYNLLSNAAKSYKGERGGITVRVSQTGESAMISVEDEGCGMSEAALRNAFDISGNPSYLLPFGLGLPLSRKIANYHGGSLFLLPRKQGTQAVFSIPTTQGKFQRKQDESLADKLAGLKIEDATFHPALIGLSDVVQAKAFAGIEEF